VATKRVKAKLSVAGKILADFAGTHHLEEADNLHQALLLLDEAIHDLETVTENLSGQIDGQTDTFQTSQPFSTVRVVLNGLEQTEGAEEDYMVLDANHIQFYRPLKQNETLKVDYTLA